MLRCVVESLLGGFAERPIEHEFALALLRLGFGEHRRLGRSKNAIEATQQGEGKDYLTIVRLSIIAPKKIGDGPDEVGERRSHL